MALKKTVRQGKQKQKSNAEQPVSDEIRRAAERIGVTPESLAESRARGKAGLHQMREERGVVALQNTDDKSVGSKLRALLSCGLHVDDSYGSGCGYDVALGKTAVAQLKAIAIALANGGDDCAEIHHQLDLRFDGLDAAEALAGVAAMLEHGTELIEDLRTADEMNEEAEVTP
jgi:hypothetical protein